MEKKEEIKDHPWANTYRACFMPLMEIRIKSECSFCKELITNYDGIYIFTGNEPFYHEDCYNLVMEGEEF